MKEQLPSLRMVAAAYKMEPMSASRWLTDLNVPVARNGNTTIHVPFGVAVAVALCRDLSKRNVLDFSTPGLAAVFDAIVRNEDEALRQAVLVVKVAAQRGLEKFGQGLPANRVVLTGPEAVILEKAGPARDGVKWEPQNLVEHWSIEGIVVQVSLGPLYTVADEVFANLGKKKAAAVPA